MPVPAVKEGDASEQLTFANYLPILVETYNLEQSSDAYTFSYVSRESPLYDAFATARAYSMIGSATRPDQLIQCRHLMVLLGLAEGWDLNYTSANVFDVFAAYAQTQGYISERCEDPLAVATFADLP